MKTKKNDLAYLLDLKIDIHADNDSQYQEIALLMDKPKFLQLLPAIRKTFNITSLHEVEDFIENIDDFYFDNLGTVDQAFKRINLTKYSKIKEIKKIYPDFYKFAEDKSNMFPEILDVECNLLCYEFNRPPYFVDSITQAICCGAVNSKHFKPTESIIADLQALGAWPTLPRVIMFLSPTSTYENVKEEFRRAKQLMSTDPTLSYYKPLMDFAPNIRKYREWYWERIKGKTYQMIADEWLETHKNENTTYLDVLKAVKTYKRLLEL